MILKKPQHSFQLQETVVERVLSGKKLKWCQFEGFENENKAKSGSFLKVNKSVNFEI